MADDDFILGRYWQPDAYAKKDKDAGRPLGCLATTYSFEAAYFEQVLVPRFLGLEFDPTEAAESFLVEREEQLQLAQVIVLVNADHYDSGQASPRWLQLPVRVPGGVLHAKVTLLVWENLIRVLVGSANLTRAGYRQNREVASVLDFYDSSEALTPKSLLVDVLAFLKELRRSTWLRAGKEARARIDEVLNNADRLQKSWKDLRSDFSSREVPRARFAPTLPTSSGRGVAVSPLTTVRELWGSRTADDVTVLTPFVGEPPSSAEKAVVELRKVFPQKTTLGHLAVPGEELNRRTWTKLPVSFSETWKRHWAGRDKECRVWVVPPRRKDDDVVRPLHAKGIVVKNADSILVMCGSSNFSVHGMGIGVANVEANLCFLDRTQKRDLLWDSPDSRDKLGRVLLHERLGVDWINDYCANPKWPKDIDVRRIDEDVLLEETNLPIYFISALHDQVKGILAIEVSAQHGPPSVWELFLKSSENGREKLLVSGEVKVSADNILIVCRETLKAKHLTVAWIAWEDSAGTRREARLPVQVEQPGAVSAGAVSGFLSAQGILECLAGDYEPARWLSRRKKTSGKKCPHDDARDSHGAVDTSAYLLYQTRQLGHAIAVLGRRVFEAPRRRTVMRYRLFDDLLGPLKLARALEKEWQPEGDRNAPARAAYMFAVAELRLTVAHVFAAMSARDRREFRPLFDELLAELPTPEAPGAASPLQEYVASAFERCRRLLSGDLAT